VIGDCARDIVDARALVETVANIDLQVAEPTMRTVTVDEHAVDPVSSRGVDRVEGDPLGGRGGGVKRYATRHLTELDKTFPLSTLTGHIELLAQDAIYAIQLRQSSLSSDSKNESFSMA
jgi:hypothetical protein